MADTKPTNPSEKSQAQDTPTQESQAPQKKSKIKLLLFIFVPLLILGIVALIAYFMGLFHSDEKIPLKEKQPPAQEKTVSSSEEASKEPLIKENKNKPENTVFYTLADMMVNLNSDKDQIRYLKLKVSFEMENQAAIDAIQPLLPKILDTIQVYMRGLRVSDLKDMAGIESLRHELLKRMNLITGKHKVYDIWFPEMLSQ